MSNIKLKKRYQLEILFKYSCLSSIILVISILSFLLLSIMWKSYGAFWQAQIKFEINFDQIDLSDSDTIDLYLKNELIKLFVNDKVNKVTLFKVISLEAPQTLKKQYKSFHGTNSVWLPASSVVGLYLKNRSLVHDHSFLYILDKLNKMEKIKLSFSSNIITNTDSREPEIAGIFGGIIGSCFTLIICIVCAIPVGIFSAIFLEEYAPKNKLRSFIEININNLAAVPSIVYGLIGLAIFINYFKFPRSSSLVGGITLALLILPTIIVTTRQSIKTIPATIKQAALALGASPMQVTIHHTLPLAIPGIVTGSILSFSRALGETAPLIMLGMIAFLADIPTNFVEAATTIPVLIFTWSDSPEYGFIEKTSAAVLILILTIIALNYLAISLRNKYEHRW